MSSASMLSLFGAFVTRTATSFNMARMSRANVVTSCVVDSAGQYYRNIPLEARRRRQAAWLSDGLLDSAKRL
ncbi:hypothetical protein M440DRAFT_1406227, partial [Trichoderma longibrachiatum ATCC 18648]